MPISKTHIKNGKSTRGYTLFEFLVALACASIVMTAMIGTLVFASNMTKRLTAASEQTRMAQAAYDYIISLDLGTLPASGEFEADGNNLLHNKKRVLETNGLTDIQFEERESIIFCRLIYTDKEYEFAAGALD